MSIGSFFPGILSQDNVRARQNASLFIGMRVTAEDLQRQLSTGKLSEDWAGLGKQRLQSLDLRAKLADYASWSDTISDATTRLKMVDAILTKLDKGHADLRRQLSPAGAEILPSGQTFGQTMARQSFSDAIDMLNQNVGGRYLFSGRSTDVRPVLPMDTLLEGSGTQAGLRTLIAERRQADLGTGTGRLQVSSGGGSISILEDAGVFGMKLGAVATDIAGATVTQPAGSPPSLSITLGAQPSDGQSVTVTLNLPDGGTTDIRLVARTTVDPGSSETAFAIGATLPDTLLNLKAALDKQVTRKAGTALLAASAVATARDFFRTDGSPPNRVNYGAAGLPIGLIAGTPADTVIWYQGDSTANPRLTASARVDDGAAVALGAQANEPAFASMLAGLAALTLDTFPATDPYRAERYAELVSRTRPPTGQTVQTVQQEFGLAAARIGDAKARNKATEIVLKETLSGIEDAPAESAAAALLTVQNRLQASYETTSMLSKLSLVNYLG